MLFWEKSIYRDHVAEIDQLAGAYARNLKNNLENQRYLTEEYLANCANAKVKPSWWKEFIARIRAWLRERFPEMRFTDKDIEGVLSMATRHLRKNSVVRDSRTADGNTGDAGNTDLRFMVDEEGNLLANVAGKGQIAVTAIVSDKSIPANTPILTNSGNLNWGFISDKMIANAPKAMQMAALPIRLHKRNHGYGLVHIAKHLNSFTGQDLIKLLENVFSKPNKIYARDNNGAIKLEVFPKPPSQWGILELRKTDGYYSIVSFYPRDTKHSKAKGKLIWEYSSQAVLLQAANSKPRQITSGTMPQEAREELATQTVDNITTLGVNVNISNNNNPEKSDLGR